MTGCQRTFAPATAASITSTMGIAPDSASASHKLQPGDCLLVTFHRKSLPSPITESVLVDTDGNITLPLVGKVQVSGLTMEAAERVITSHYQSPPYGDKISVKVSWCECS
jgi:polysaccharide export outer membrane protein